MPSSSRNNFGQISEARHQPGAVAYSADLQLRLLQETTNEMARNGCRKIIIANGHGGNDYFLPYFAQSQLASRHRYVVYVFGLPNLAGPARPKLHHARDGHAGEAETSDVLISRPDLVHSDRGSSEQWQALHRLHLPAGVFTGIAWYAMLPNHYAGDATAANKELGEYNMKTWIDKLVDTIQAVKADDVSLQLQNEFYDELAQPLKTRQ